MELQQINEDQENEPSSPQPSAPPLILISSPRLDDGFKVSKKKQEDALLTRVELTISAQNLLDRDAFSISDPVCVVYMQETVSKKISWVEVGRTEQIKNNLNPEWNTKFVMEYRFEERQIMKFAIYDWDSKDQCLSQHDFLGKTECSLGEIVAAPNHLFVRQLQIPPPFIKKSTITILAEELGVNKMMLGMKINGRNLEKKDFFGKSDPFLQITKKLDNGSFGLIHKTEILKKTLNPDWRYFNLRVSSLTSGGNLERMLRFQVFDWNHRGNHSLIGEFECSYAEITENFNTNQSSYELINKVKQAKKKRYKNSGTLNIVSMNVYEEKTFLDYIQNGVQLYFSVAVDFTSSNGNPDLSTSLHFRKCTEDNQYSLAIKAVGEIIQDYNEGKLFPAFGFGAKIPPTNLVSHNFPLNGVRENPCCEGVDGILKAYLKTIKSVTLHGPTYFAPVIRQISNFANLHQDGRNYFVLLIITDGIITDFEATKEAIVNASILPLSIIIIGVGNEDFKEMEELDSDGTLLKFGERKAARDIVQFVELRKFMSTKHNPPRISPRSQTSLARNVLMELPGQVVHWMRYYGPEKNLTNEL